MMLCFNLPETLSSFSQLNAIEHALEAVFPTKRMGDLTLSRARNE